MKRFYFSILFLLFASIANAQISAVNTFTAQSYYKASTVTDTSATITIGGYPFVSVATTCQGADSTPMTVKIDGLVNGVWSNTLTSQVVTLGKPAGYTLASTKGSVANFFIRIPSSADLTQNCNQIRIRNVHAAFAAGSTDSTSALLYTQNVLLRLP